MSWPPPAEPTLSGFDEFVEVGRGGFGVVYRAREVDHDRNVAVKILSGPLDERSRRRFDRERRAMGSLSGHPNIVTVYASGFLGDGRPYIVMEYLPGSLADRLASDGPTRWPDAFEIGMKLAGALGSAHAGGVLHRDVKPENVLMSAFGEPKLGDFGVAHVAGATLTTNSQTWVTIAHSAPEVLHGDPATERSDLYSLGSTIYTMIAGAPAFLRDTDETVMPVFARVLNDPVPDLRSRGVPEHVCALVEQTMAKVPGERPGTADELRERLSEARSATLTRRLPPGGHDPPPPPAPRPDPQPPPAPGRGPAPPGRGWKVALVLALVVVGVIALLVVLANSDDDEPVVCGEDVPISSCP